MRFAWSRSGVVTVALCGLLLQSHQGVADEASCERHLLSANVFEDAKDVQKLGIYADCVALLLHSQNETRAPKRLHVAGSHYPTLVVSDHRDPPVVYEGLRDGPETPHTFVLPAYDLNIGHAMKLVGTHNLRQSYEMQVLLRPGDGYIDVGANLGAYVIPMAERVGRGGKVLAFEPFLHTFQHLTANVAINGLSNVRTVQAALGNGTTRRVVAAPRMDYFTTLGAMRVDGQPSEDSALGMGITYDGEEEVQIFALDDYLETLRRPPFSQLRLMKIDVEGMEIDVVMGARRTIRELKPIIWAENVAYFESEDMGFVAALHSLEYACSKADSAPQDLICSDAQGRGHQP